MAIGKKGNIKIKTDTLLSYSVIWSILFAVRASDYKIINLYIESTYYYLYTIHEVLPVSISQYRDYYTQQNISSYDICVIYFRVVCLSA